MVTRVMLFALILVIPLISDAHPRGRLVEYSEGGQVLEGYLTFDPAKVTSTTPAVLVVHEWMGLNDYAKKRADQLAALGYIAFAVDIYGKGIRPRSREEAGKLAGQYRGDRALFRRRVLAGFNYLRSVNKVDTSRIAAIGYCFGGTGVLELARSGAPVAGVVSFHGGLDSPTPQDAKNILGKVLVLHGADDPAVPPAQVNAFMEEMRATDVDWQFHAYSDAVHAFTNPEAGNDPSRGAAYNERADKRSWQEMLLFFEELFKR
jgi:dienelactone hydrolase